MWRYFLVLAGSRVISGIMYRKSSAIIENKPLQGEARLFALSGFIFPTMTGVLYILPYIMHTPGKCMPTLWAYIRLQVGFRHSALHALGLESGTVTTRLAVLIPTYIWVINDVLNIVNWLWMYCHLPAGQAPSDVTRTSDCCLQASRRRKHLFW